VPAVAALLERRPALLALRRALPQRTLRVLTARSPAHLASLLDRHLVDLVVVGLESARGATFEALRNDYPSLPTVVYGPVRSDDAAAVRRVLRRGAAAVLLEGLDEPVLARVLRRNGFTGRREAALLPLAPRLDLVDPLQIAAWQLIVTEAPMGLSTATLAKRLGVSRETLSRRFGAGRAPSLKTAIDAVRLVAVGQLLGSPVWRVADAARLLGYSSESLLQRSSRRLVGSGARSLGSLRPDRILARLVPATGRRWG
jgi:AraC-like DNA-binding protein